MIFTDESTIQLESHARKSFRKKDAPRKLKYHHKHPPKAHKWAGISNRGATCIAMFNGTVNATQYGDILYISLILFIQAVYPARHRLCQDNSPKHTSCYIQDVFKKSKINWWKSPAESPDLNLINKVWGTMKTSLQDKHKPRNVGELKEGFEHFGGR